MDWLDDFFDWIGGLFGDNDPEPPKPDPVPTGANVNVRVRAAGGGNVSIEGATVRFVVKDGKEKSFTTDDVGWVKVKDVTPGPRHLYVTKAGYRSFDQHFEVKRPTTTFTVAIVKGGVTPIPPGPTPPLTSDKVTAIRRVAAEYIDEYEDAHVGRVANTVQPKQEAFVRRAAACLHYGAPTLGIKGDDKTMLLGQGGGNVISQDVVLYNGGYYDFIIGAGQQGRDLSRITWHRGGPQGNAKAIQPDKDLVPKAPVVKRRTGIVRGDRSVFVDNQGPWYPVGCTVFPAVWLYLKDRGKYVANLQWMHELGIDYQRILGQTGGGGHAFWSDRTWNANDPKFPGWLGETIDLAYDYGVRSKLTMFGGDGYSPTSDDKRRFVDTCVSVGNGRKDAIFIEEVANEFYHDSILQNNIPLLRELGRRANEKTNILVALSAPMNMQHGTDMYLDSGVQVGTAHTLRVGSTGIPRADVRRIRGFPALREDGEPRGPGASAGGDVSNPATLANDLRESAKSGIGAYCYHSDAGVTFGSKNAPKLKNLWDQPNGEACVKAIVAARDSLPKDVANR